jgi:hypothetical protein
MITKDDFSAWLNDPVTKFFRAWLEKDKTEIKEAELSRIYRNSTDLEVVKASASVLSICRGLDRVSDMLNDCAEQKKEEAEMEALEEKERKPVYDVISDHIKFVYGGENE